MNQSFLIPQVKRGKTEDFGNGSVHVHTCTEEKKNLEKWSGTSEMSHVPGMEFLKWSSKCGIIALALVLLGWMTPWIVLTLSGSLVIWDLQQTRDKFLFSTLERRAGIHALYCILTHMHFNIYYQNNSERKNNSY